MDHRDNAPCAPPLTDMSMDDVEELHAEADEPPDETQSQFSRYLAQNNHVFGKAHPRLFERRESLLTQQLLSETEQTDEERVDGPPRALSTQSTHSAQSTTSTADLTSDDGHSMPSPAISPPFPPALANTGLASLNHVPFLAGGELKIVDIEDRKLDPPTSEQSVEANLGRKRCISFACGKKDVRPPTSQPRAPEPVAPAPVQSTSPPKRKCTLKFVCPTRTASDSKPLDPTDTPSKRSSSPAPVERRPSTSILTNAVKVHRGSDSTVRHASPRASRKSPPPAAAAPLPTISQASKLQRKFSHDSEDDGEATRFHEFASSDDEPEEWCQESTAYRSRLTITDTLQKENIIRRACEEVEEEVIEEEEEEEEQLDNEDDEHEDEDEEGGDEEEDDQSDDGFRTDDEGGFAESDSDGDDSDADWWTPGGLSTAATSVEHIERLLSQLPAAGTGLASSLGSGASDPMERSISLPSARKHRSDAVNIDDKPDVSDLPDSTDFVCGTLDEDRPVEQAFLNSMKQREAAKHQARPQDIDPTFPTSDLEMDEEDDEDLEDPKESEAEDGLIHGDLDELNGDLTARPRTSPRVRNGNSRRSRSPAPVRMQALGRSPAPPVRRNTRSPPPPAPARRRSPAPPVRRNTRSPPPPTQARRRSPAPAKTHGTARSPPPPRKLFGHSPQRAKSPAPRQHYTSPPNTRRTSPTNSIPHTHALDVPQGLAFRPGHLTHTASLPRGGPNVLSRLNSFHLADETDAASSPATHEHAASAAKDLPKRGAIDIVKGLEKKRQRRKEKLQQKAAAKAALKKGAEKPYKVKPGRGAERMREVGLELQRYRGKGEHIISM